jgi:hypothetical protein
VIGPQTEDEIHQRLFVLVHHRLHNLARSGNGLTRHRVHTCEHRGTLVVHHRLHNLARSDNGLTKFLENQCPSIVTR